MPETEVVEVSRVALLLLLLPPLLSPGPPAIADGDERVPGWIGITFGNPLGPLPGTTVEPEREPIVIRGVSRDSPAARAGLRARDTVVAFEGQPVEHPRELVTLVRSREPGDWTTLTIRRGAIERDVRVRLDRRPDDRGALQLRRAWLGVETLSLPETLQRHFGGEAGAGVLVADVAAGSPAAAGDVRIGDLLRTFGGREVTSHNGLVSMAAAAGVGNTAILEVVRDGVPLTLEILMRERPEESNR